MGRGGGNAGAGRRRGGVPVALWVLFGALAAASLGAGAAVGTLLGYEYNLPPVQRLEDYRPDVITTIYSEDGKPIGEFAVERRILATYDEMPPHLLQAIVATEDALFYHHDGVNYFAIARAVAKDFARQSYPIGKGASTITMQLSRMLLESYEKTWDRKIKEIWIARAIEKRYSKRQILTLYANLHIMGPGIYGVAAAADYYFGKQLPDLTLEECALIAGLPRSPSRYSPRAHPDNAKARRDFVLNRMADERMITREEAEAAKRLPIALKPVARDSKAVAPHFVELVRQSLATHYSTDDIWRKGMRVYTTLDVSMQAAARRALQDGLRDFDKKRGWRGPIGHVPPEELGAYAHPSWGASPQPGQPGDIVVGLVQDAAGKEAVVRVGDWRGRVGRQEVAWTKAKAPADILKAGDLAWFRIVSLDGDRRAVELRLEQRPLVEGALVVLQNGTGEVRAMVGGYDFAASEFNRVTQAMRQVGSTFKPIVYAAALEKGMDPDGTVLDEPVSFQDGLGREWTPHNYDRRFEGEITLRQALAQSRNVPAVKIADQVGIQNVVVMARRFGLGGRLDPYLPLALGTAEATPLEMASAFTVFPNLGLQSKPWFIRRVEDYDRIEKEEHSAESRRVLDPATAAAMLDLLQGVVQNGTAAGAKSLARPLGGKTGTTNNFTDAWFVGFTPSLTAAVWVGYDEEKTLGDRQSGGAVALPIWIDCMGEILKDRPVEQFPTVEVAIPADGDPEAPSPIYVEDLPN
ncbi:MAG: PBP1A family penicillin-binding protein [Acidobacteriota bacterium]|nr:PBP1A family penicillin-binding protein [Acidobacteriota bacterium]